MKHLIFIIPFTFITLLCYSQENNDNKKTLHFKGYTNFRYDQSRNLNYVSYYLRETEEKSLTIGKISVAIEQVFSENFSQEIELFIPNFGYTDYTITAHNPTSLTSYPSTESNKTYFADIYCRYQINYYFLNPQNNFRFLIGVSTGLRYNFCAIKPTLGLSYPETYNILTIPIEAIAGFKIRLIDRLFFHMNIPFEINNFVIETHKVDNPSLPIKMQLTTDIYGILIPKSFNLRLGLSYKF
ncbi:MAG: hypothetical protein PHW82_06780 [Bacteroidales bacterium]|nr:hypothetical protein [Bacteroidales bacterium]